MAGHLLAAIIVAVIFHAGLMARLSVNDSHKVGMPLLSSRTDPSDNYAYFSLMKRGLAACRTQAEPTATAVEGNALACTYLGGILPAHLLFRTSELLTGSSRAALSLVLVLNTALLAFAFLVAFTAVTDRRLSIAASTALAGASLYALDNFSLSFFYGRLYLNFPAALGTEPNLARLMNPAMFWSLGLLSLAAMLVHLRESNRLSAGLAVLFAAFCSTASLAVTASLGAGLGLFSALSLILRRRLSWVVLAVAFTLGLGLAFTMLQFRLYYATELGHALRHGQFSGLQFAPSFLILLLPAVFGRVNASDRERDLLMKCILVAAATVGAFCSSVDLGARLWLRGAAILALLYCVAWLWISAEWLIRRTGFSFGLRAQTFGEPRRRRWLAAATTLACGLALLGAVVLAKPPRLDGWRGFLDRDKYEALLWLDDHVKPGMTIASTNIEDSFLIDFYTQGSAFVPLYGLSALPWDEQLRRYFHAIDQVEEGDDIFDRLSKVTKASIGNFHQVLSKPMSAPFDYAGYQSAAFCLILLYYPYNAQAEQLFDATGKLDDTFLRWFADLRDEARRRTYDHDYLVVLANEHIKSGDRYEEVYRNPSYVIVRSRIRAPEASGNQ